MHAALQEDKRVWLQTLHRVSDTDHLTLAATDTIVVLFSCDLIP